MAVLKFVCVGLIIAMVVAGALLPETTEKARIIDGIGKGVFASFGLLMLSYFGAFFKGHKGSVATDIGQVTITRDSVVVDGSNVMHWGGDPSLKVLSRVLKELEIRGLEPVVYFDANVGYKLTGKHVKPAVLAADLGLSEDQVIYAPKRVPADEILLAHATRDKLRVVTNDKYLDWKQKFPKVGEKDFLIKGIWKEGSVIFLGLGRTSAAR